MKQLEIPLVTDQQKVSVTEFVTDAQMSFLQRFCQQGILPFVEEYQPSRRKQKYYRVSWRDGKKVKHLHIPGGNINSKLAQYRAGKLRKLIARGAELDEVIAQVQTFAQGEV